MFLFGDMLVFGVFFVTFMVERAKAPELFDVARTSLHIGVGVTNTLVLLTSSLCIVVALGAIRAGAKSIAAKAVSAAIAFGLLFICLKVYEYVSLATSGHGPGANDFFLYYFILTGLHLFHVRRHRRAGVPADANPPRRHQLHPDGGHRGWRVLLAPRRPAVDLPVRAAVPGELMRGLRCSSWCAAARASHG